MPRCVITFVLCACVLSGFSQNDSIHDQVHVLDTVVVSRLRSHRSLQSTTPLHTLGHNDLQRMGVSTMADALHRIPGITLRDYGGAGGMKTVSVRGFGTQHTGVSYDGILLNNSQNGEIDLSHYSLDNLGSLSLLVGDNDQLFIPARNASVPSLLLLETRSMLFDDAAPHVTSQLRVGSFGYVGPFVRYEQKLSSRMALSALGEYVYAENDYPFTLRNVSVVTRERRTNSRMNTGHAELNASWLPVSHHELKAKVYYYDNRQQLPGIVRYYTNESDETLHTQNFFAQAQYVVTSLPKWSFKWLGKFNWSSSNYRNGNYPDGVVDGHYWQREAYTSACVLYAPSRQWAFDYSVDYIFNNLNSSRLHDVKPYRQALLQTLSATYRQQRFKVLARLLGSLYFNGARKGDGSDDMRRLSPSVSLSYQLLHQPAMYLRASYKNIFRVPTFNENYFYHYGSKDLKPELTDQLNIGLTFLHDQSPWRIEASLDGYLNHVKDKIVAVPYNMFVWSNINVGKVRILGLDAMLRAACQLVPQHVLRYTGSYGFQRAANRTLKTSPYYNNQIAYMPLHSGSMSLAYENPWVNLTWHASGVSSNWSNNEHHDQSKIGGYMEWGVMAARTFKVWRHSLAVRADVKNIFNRQYEIVAGYPMPGIQYQITMNYQF
ncbi:TonB-dependent receptor domain-containing protein [Hoylesella buccalis]|uniref:TonB-dependent receptor plug domain-containing protein n=1 Tax=Hoylesella buccalis TaxID=28127 RepID=UPI00288BB869|nr:TonB-dependent receptor [Hoylesella buccalis]